MSRASDIALVMRALDRAEASPHEEIYYEVASLIVDLGDTLQRFVRHTRMGWTTLGVRLVVAAFASQSPPDELRRMARVARELIAFCEWWDAEGWIESQGEFPLPWHDEIRGAA